MEKALRPLPLEKHPRLLVGTETADDAGVYQLTDDMALVQTVDFITPIVDDPYTFGQIAAANSLSDVYAMGGRPITAMNIVGFPGKSVSPSVLTEILRGGLSKVHEAGALLMGGHTVEDPELKYGLAVTGLIHPQKILTNRTAEVGDALILTKALGTGLLSTAHKGGMVDSRLFQEATDSMVRLNQEAARAMEEIGAHACTDVTGFGLLGHTVEMARGAGLSFRISYSSIPLLPGAQACAATGMVPGGAYCNERHFLPEVSFSAGVPEGERIILFDPQTSGGLLIALAAKDSEALLRRLKERGVLQAARIGEVTRREKALITVEP